MGQYHTDCLPACAPGVTAGGIDSLASLLPAILACAPPKAVYIGWSLGGQLAAELAASRSERVCALISICSNPRFCAEGDWPGMAAATLQAFRARFEQDPGGTLARFASLQVAGAVGSRSLLRQLQRGHAGAVGGDLLAGLDWLRQLDTRDLLMQLNQPQLHLLGERDALVPPALEPVLAGLLKGNAQARVQSLGASSHAAPLEVPAVLAEAIGEFLQHNQLLRTGGETGQSVAKKAVADSFSRAASEYDSVASLQREVGQRLLVSLDQLPSAVTHVLDLGCGTGFFHPQLQARFPQASYTGLDLAQGMVEYAREQHPRAGSWLVGDAESLPLASESVDVVFSSLAIQWCYRPDLLFAELSRVLRPGGICVFSSLGPDTLRELRAAWAAVDDHQHVNEFLPVAELQAAVAQVADATLELAAETFRMHYQRVPELLRELKTLGAHNMNSGRPAGLTAPRSLQRMFKAYEVWREAELLPATYDVIFGVLKKHE